MLSFATMVPVGICEVVGALGAQFRSHHLSRSRSSPFAALKNDRGCSRQAPPHRSLGLLSVVAVTSREAWSPPDFDASWSGAGHRSSDIGACPDLRRVVTESRPDVADLPAPLLVLAERSLAILLLETLLFVHLAKLHERRNGLAAAPARPRTRAWFALPRVERARLWRVSRLLEVGVRVASPEARTRQLAFPLPRSAVTAVHRRYAPHESQSGRPQRAPGPGLLDE